MIQTLIDHIRFLDAAEGFMCNLSCCLSVCLSVHLQSAVGGSRDSPFGRSAPSVHRQDLQRKPGVMNSRPPDLWGTSRPEEVVVMETALKEHSVRSAGHRCSHSASVFYFESDDLTALQLSLSQCY